MFLWKSLMNVIHFVFIPSINNFNHSYVIIDEFYSLSPPENFYKWVLFSLRANQNYIGVGQFMGNAPFVVFVNL